MNVARPICVHIGLPKSATTMLQRGLFARHSELELLGKRVGAADALRRCSSEASFRLGNQLFWDQALTIDAEEAKRIYSDEILAKLGSDRMPVFSYEGLAAESLARREAIARNLRDVFDGCKVVLGIRRPVELIESLYFHQLKRRHLGAQAGRFEFLRSPSPGDWLDSVVPGDAFANHLDYARTLRIFSDALGRANVGVFALEMLEADACSFAESLCRFLEIGASEGIRLLDGRRDNIRLTQPVVDRMSRFGRGGGRSIVYALAGRKVRKRLLGIGRDDAGPAARLSIPESVRASMAARTREGNAWVAKEWSLPLGDFGYPV